MTIQNHNVLKAVIIFSLTVLLLLSVAHVSAQTSDYTREVYVRFDPGIVHLDAKNQKRICDSTTIESHEILSVVNQFGQAEIEKIFDDEDSVERIVLNPAGIPIKRPTFYGIYKLTLADSSSARAVKQDLSSLDQVQFTHQNGLKRTDEIVPNDSSFYRQWNLYSFGQFNTVLEADIDAAEAWELETGDSTVIMSVHDTGVKGDHPDLVNRVIGDVTTYPSYHGTFVAGIMGAEADNNIGIAGLNWNSTVKSYYCGPNPLDDFLIWMSVISAAESGVTSSNHSYSGPDFDEQELSTHVYAYNMNVLACAAAGNQSSSNPRYPSGYWKVLTVSASTAEGLFAEDYSNFGSHIDVCAPGGSTPPAQWLVYSTSVNGEESTYGYSSGTSFSTPQVTALAGLLKSYNPELWNDDIAYIMILSADDFGDTGWDPYFGHGKINARKALEFLQEPNHFFTDVVTDGYVYEESDLHHHGFKNVPGLDDVTYITKRYELRKHVTYPTGWHWFGGVWGVGPRSNGYPNHDPTRGYLFSDIIDSTQTGFTVRTFVYEVWSLGGDYKGFFPCEPSEAVMSYSFLGEPELEPITSFSTHYDVWIPEERIQLSWTDNNDYEQGFIIERKDATNDVWSAIDTVPNQQYGSYYDYDIIGSETYWYRVKPFTVNQTDIAWTPELQIKALPAPPENVSCRVLPGITCCPVRLSNEVEVTWQEPSPGKQLTPIEYYKVLRKDDYFWNPQKWFGPIYDTVLNICPNESGDIWMYIVMSYDSEGDSSILNNYCTARPGSSNRCPGQIEKDNVGDMLPYEFSLSQNYPNPFNPSTRIDYSVPVDGHVRLDVVDILGRVVCVLVDEIQPAGEYSIEWRGVNSSGSPAASGVYFYRLQTKTHSAAKRMVLLK